MRLTEFLGAQILNASQTVTNTLNQSWMY